MLPNGFNLVEAVRLLENAAVDAGDIELAFDLDTTPQGRVWWTGANAIADDDYDEDEEDPYLCGPLTKEAEGHIKAWVAEALGLTPKRPDKDDVGFQPMGAVIGRVAEETIVKAQAEERAAKDALPLRAMAFGQPQIVGGTGQWDNARYFTADDEL